MAIRIEAAARLVSRDYDVTALGTSRYITLMSIPPSSFTLKDIKRVPYAYLDFNFVWNKNTEDAATVPTLVWVGTSKKTRDQGFGVALVQSVLSYLKTSKVPLMAFDNYNHGFWDAMQRRFGSQVQFPDKFKGSIGFLVPSGKASLPLPL